MENANKRVHAHIAYFNPDVTSLQRAHQDFSLEIKRFNAGKGFENFNEFIFDEAVKYKEDGDGVTYLIWNVLYDESGKEIRRDLVSYYTLAVTAIPYEDRIRLDEEEAKLLGKDFDIEVCGISALELKMFAVDEQFQDVFYEYKGEDLPISAWIMRNIIDYAESLSEEVIGFKALFLHSVPEAEKFYVSNGFHPVEVNMRPLHCVDSEYRPMYLALKAVHMNYDE